MGQEQVYSYTMKFTLFQSPRPRVVRLALISPIQAGIKTLEPHKGIRQLPLLLRERIQNAALCIV